MGRASILWLAACGVLGLLCLWCGSDTDGGPAIPNTQVSAFKATTEYRTCSIEDPREGDMVVAWDPVTGQMGRHEIVDSFRRSADHLRVLEFLAADGATQTISTTDEHPFWSVEAEDYVAAGEFELGDHLIGPAGEIATLIGSRREEHPAGVPVHNFEVSDVHNYYVRAHGLRAPPLRVHNAMTLTCGLTDETPLYRGVPGNETEKARLGRLGIAKPRGTRLDADALRRHVKNEFVDAGVTSWTTSREQALRFAGRNGTIIETIMGKVRHLIVPRPNVGKYDEELELLLRGVIHGVPTRP